MRLTLPGDCWAGSLAGGLSVSLGAELCQIPSAMIGMVLPGPLTVVMSGIAQDHPEELGDGRRAFRFVMVLAVFAHPYWLVLTAFVGLNLIQSAFTNWCPMVWFLAKLGLEPCAVGVRQ